MAEKLSPKKLGLSLGIVFAAMHVLGVLAMTNLIQYWQWVHFLKVQYVVSAFSFGTFLLGALVAFVVGMILGYVVALLYNKL